MKTTNDFYFGQKLIETYTGTEYVVVGIQPDNGPDGAIVCFEKDKFTPVVFSPKDFGDDQTDFTLIMRNETETSFYCVLRENNTGESINLGFFDSHKHMCGCVNELSSTLDMFFGTVTVR